ncbi:MAG: hypothetical protein HEQ39_16535 [Rhizobacter sp.]
METSEAVAWLPTIDQEQACILVALTIKKRILDPLRRLRPPFVAASPRHRYAYCDGLRRLIRPCEVITVRPELVEG